MTQPGRSSEEEFLEELRRDFALEAEEHLQTIVSGLVDLEKDPAHPVVEKVYRAAHSLKGAAHAVQMPSVATLCQAMESVFSALKKGLLFPLAEDFDVLQRSADAVERMVAGHAEKGLENDLVRDLERVAEMRRSSGGGLPGLGRKSVAPQAFPSPGTSSGTPSSIREEGPDAEHFPESGEGPPSQDHVPHGRSAAGTDARTLSVVEISDAGRSTEAERSSSPQEEGAERTPESSCGESPAGGRGGAAQTIRISAARLDFLLIQAEELIAVKLALQQRAEDLEEILAPLASWKKDMEQVEQRRRKGVVDAVAWEEVFQEHRSRLLETEDALRRLRKSLFLDAAGAGTLIRNLLEGTREVLLRPFSSLLQTFPKMVRDISRDLGKRVELVVRGDDIEVDKRILEGLKDPLIHLVRNAMDHGLETPQDRLAQGKGEQGTLSLLISRTEGSRVELLVRDDGRGLDPERIREGAVKAGVLSRHEAQMLDLPSTLRLIFRSGVSTSPLITSLSGRGLGMAIVQEGVERLGGRISLDSTLGQGTTFRISLPLTLATFRGVLVEEWGQRFVVPTAQVVRVIRATEEQFRRVENRETVVLHGEPVPCFRLGRVLELPEPSGEKTAEGPGGKRSRGGFVPPHSRRRTLVLLSMGASPLAFEVESVQNEQEILLKPLGPQLLRVRFVAGATVLGSGSVVPVLNPSDLIRGALGSTAPSAGSSPKQGASGELPQERPAILVAEDSITSRTLIKNILTTAGYDVTAVVDGMAAWTALGEKRYAALVSDVEMPRMGGFDLTARVRADPRWAELPVVLITSLESREDRERGVEVGAHAYLVKSSFDQGNLLDILGRLI